MLSAIRIRGLHGEARVTAAGLVCTSCGTEASRGSAKYCDACGSLLADGAGHAEFKQVTVLFADVVRSMEIAATVGAERLREIMTGLVGRAVAVVQRYGGTVDKFTGRRLDGDVRGARRVGGPRDPCVFGIPEHSG
jgi:class 3 adenylate cyclase